MRRFDAAHISAASQWGPASADERPRASLPSVRIAIARGHARELVREVAGAVYLIGGGLDCDLVLGDAQFPDVCAYLFVSKQGVRLRWLGVGPEITVNGRPVVQQWLLSGDRIRMGPFEFIASVTWPDEPAVGSPAPAGQSRSRGGLPSPQECNAWSLLSDVRNELE